MTQLIIIICFLFLIYFFLKGQYNWLGEQIKERNNAWEKIVGKERLEELKRLPILVKWRPFKKRRKHF